MSIENASAKPDWRDTERALVVGLRRRETRLSARAKARWLAAGSFYVKTLVLGIRDLTRDPPRGRPE